MMDINCLNCDEPLLRGASLGEIRLMATNIEIRITCQSCWKTSALPNMELAHQVFDSTGNNVMVYGCHSADTAIDMAYRMHGLRGSTVNKIGV